MAKKYRQLTVWEDDYHNMIHVQDEAGNMVKEYNSTSQWNNAKRFAVKNADEAFTRGYNFRPSTRIPAGWTPTPARRKVKQPKPRRMVAAHRAKQGGGITRWSDR